MTRKPARSDSTRALPQRRYATSVFTIMCGLMVIDHLDRQIVVSMFPFFRSHWQLSDAQLGAIVSIVSVTVAVGTIPLSFLADRWGRVRSLVVMALVWSGATIACAFATSYDQLLAARALVGVGEAAYGSVGCALLAAIFPGRTRSTVLGTFLVAGLIGAVLGVTLGGVLAQRWGWQAGLGLAGLPGLVLALLLLAVARECPTPPLPVATASGELRALARALIAELSRPRSALVACVGSGLQLIVVATAYAWLPSYLNRYYGLAAQHAGLTAGVIVLMGLPGAIFSSIITDRLAGRDPRARLHVPAFAAILTAICMSCAFGVLSPGPLQLSLIGLGAMTMTGTVGPVTAAVIEVVHPAVRGTAAGVLAATNNLFGLAIGPVLAGLISDRYGLPVAMTVVPLLCAVAALVFAAAAQTYAHDYARAEQAHLAD